MPCGNGFGRPRPGRGPLTPVMSVPGPADSRPRPAFPSVCPCVLPPIMFRASAKAKHVLACASRLRQGALRALATSVPQDSDVVIVGGGPAGLALASALSMCPARVSCAPPLKRYPGSQPAIRDTLRVVLVEASDLSKVRNWNEGPSTFSNRVSSITNASQAFLEGARAWLCNFVYVAQSWTKRLAHGRMWTRGGHVRSKRCR